MTHINPRVVAHMAAHHGLITPWQARDLGMSTTWIHFQLREHLWLVLHRGVYVDAATWHALDRWHAQPLLRARAAVMVMERGWVLSHDSAAHALGLDLLEVPGPPVHVTRPGVTNAWSSERVKHHLARFAPEDVVEVDGLRVLDRTRTAIDVAREHGLRAGLVTADAALRQGLSKSALWNVLDGMVNWPYVTTARAVVDLADGRSQSAAETLARELLVELGLADIDLQWPVQRADGRVAWCDLRVGRHVFEVHGKVKVLSPADGGVADRPAADVLWDTRKRERHLTAEGLGVTNLYWDDFFGAGRAAARARVLAELQQTLERFGGNVLPEHLDRNAREIRARERRTDAS